MIVEKSALQVENLSSPMQCYRSYRSSKAHDRAHEHCDLHTDDGGGY